VPTAFTEADLSTLRSTVRGAVLRDGDQGYDRARHVWNAMIDRRPAAIVRCESVADVVAAVAFARAHGLLPTIKGGGHGVSGKAVSDGGLMIDLSPMQTVEVDAERRTARVQGGATLAAFDAATQAAGLATTAGVVGSTGVGGLTLGGGIGFIMRKYGLTCDNLLEAEVVTSAGEVVTANAQLHPDLFWALRGGGGNFGVVTSFTFRLYPLTTVLSGHLVYPMADALAVARGYRDFIATAPDDVTVYLNINPDRNGEPTVFFDVCYCGDPAVGDSVIAPLRQLGRPLEDSVRWIPYLTMQARYGEALPEGKLNFWKSSFVDTPADDLFEIAIDRVTNAPGPELVMNWESLGGAVGRVDPAATAFADRSADFTVIVTGHWSDPSRSASYVAWIRETWNLLQPYVRPSGYINYFDVEDDNRTVASYGPNFRRLAEIKRAYDPDNLFRHNLNITPA
jgi:FAD/FMN-containing dehydrogenase